MRSLVLLAMASAVGVASPQAPPPPSAALVFEVASVKIRTDGGGGSVVSSPDRFTRSGARLRDLIRDAYDLQPFQIVGGPEWIGSARFDVSAKASFIPSPEQMRAMVRQLLADRFALKAHRDTREMAAYRLVLARSDGRLGPQLARTTVDCASIDAERAQRGEGRPLMPAQPGEPPVCAAFTSTRSRTSPAGVSITLRQHSSGAPLRQLAAFLATVVRQTVVDRTGLSGDFDWDLEFARAGAASGEAAAPEEGASVFTAVQEQLGLKLESHQGPVDVLVIESASAPMPD
jgi:uncharacterized protein (TIGR03435 family)